jgi:hypothetical protein
MRRDIRLTLFAKSSIFKEKLDADIQASQGFQLNSMRVERPNRAMSARVPTFDGYEKLRDERSQYVFPRNAKSSVCGGWMHNAS